MKLVTATDVWYTQQQKTLDEMRISWASLPIVRTTTGLRETRIRFCST